jgi:methionyl-tRNA formyltransferase
MTNSTKVVFMGTPDFAVPSLRALIDGGVDILLVVTQPDRPRGRGRGLLPPPVKVVAEESGIEVAQPVKISDPGFMDKIRGLNPDLIVVAAFGQFLPKELLDIPPMGCVNVHASVLPKYRGAAPANWAILRGEKVTGVTTILLNEGMDAGDMLLVKETPIGEDETAGELTERLADIGAGLLVETITGLEKGTINPVPQDHDKKTLAPMLKKEDGRIDWERSPGEIKNHVRGMTPRPGAFTTLSGEVLKVFKVDVTDGKADGRAGEVVGITESGIVVAAKGGGVVITELQAPGKRRMGAGEFLRGKGIETGTILGGE